MAITMKGRIFRGLKIIAQIFVQREQEHEIEIGYPTDVRHVSHIGFGAGGSCPSWMNEFRGVQEVAAAVAAGGSTSSAAPSRQTSWASIEFEQPAGGVPPPAEACTAAAAIAGAATTRATPKRPAARLKKARASSPGSSSSWRSTASFATACSDSGDLHSADLRAA